MYGQLSQTQESSGGKWINPGIEEVFYKEMTVVELDGANYKGEVCDTIIENISEKTHNK